LSVKQPLQELNNRPFELFSLSYLYKLLQLHQYKLPEETGT
jgi:hypothetical protein